MLSFEDFSNRNHRLGIPRYNNFYGYFAPGTLIGITYQKKGCYRRFATEQPEMTTKLCRRVREEILLPKIDPPKSIDHDLYEAYRIMSGYGISDEDLFS